MKAATTAEAVKTLREYGPTCSPKQLAGVLGGNPYYYNIAAKNGTLDFDYMWSGNALRIFTESVITKITGGNVNAGADDQSE